MRMLASVAIALQVLGGADTAADPFAFFGPDASPTPVEREALARGVPWLRVLETDGREIGVVSAIALDPRITSERIAAWIRAVDRMRTNQYVVATGRIPSTPAIRDFAGLTLEPAEIDGLRVCRPGRCSIKLSGPEIEEIGRAIAGAGDGWPAAAQAAFQEVALRRVTRFLVGGYAALDPHHDHHRPRDLAASLGGLVEHSVYLRRQVPDLAASLAACPPRHADGFLYWSKERLGGKTVLTVTHVRLVRGDGVTSPAQMAVGVQVFSTHYTDGALAVTAFVRDPGSGTRYLVHVNHTEVDLLGGFWGAFARRALESRLRTDGPGILRAVATRMAEERPPVRVEETADRR